MTETNGGVGGGFSSVAVKFFFCVRSVAGLLFSSTRSLSLPSPAGGEGAGEHKADDSSFTEQHTSGEQVNNGSGAPPLDTPNTLSSPSEDRKKGSDQSVKEKSSGTTDARLMAPDEALNVGREDEDTFSQFSHIVSQDEKQSYSD